MTPSLGDQREASYFSGRKENALRAELLRKFSETWTAIEQLFKVQEWIEKLWYMEYYAAVKKKKKRGISYLWDIMDGPGEYYSKLNKPI